MAENPEVVKALLALLKMSISSKRWIDLEKLQEEHFEHQL